MLHLPTLLLVNTLVMGLAGGLLLYSWCRGRQERTLLWMGSMLLLAVPGLIINTLRGFGFDYLPIVLGNMLVLFVTGMNWMAMRVFCGRALHWPGLLSGPLLWALLCLWPTFYQEVSLRIAGYSLLVIGYMLAGMRELLRSRPRLPVSIGPALILMAMHLLFYLVRPLVDSGSPMGSTEPSAFYGWVVVESMLYAVGAGFFALAMVKERAEAQQRHAALTDPLTGIGNRRSFSEAARRLLEAPGEQTLTLLLCDLDHFKQINDRLGHPVGDRVLQSFAGVLREVLGEDAVFGRIGGEEFACLLPLHPEHARALAERIRRQFAEQVSEQGELSVSIGLADTRLGGRELSGLLALADAALYQAKQAGRDRVVLAQGQELLLEIAAAGRRRFR